ncbi:hypothetical protein B7463_g616, partial [Scytalidium lignicola]
MIELQDLIICLDEYLVDRFRQGCEHVLKTRSHPCNCEQLVGDIGQNPDFSGGNIAMAAAGWKQTFCYFSPQEAYHIALENWPIRADLGYHRVSSRRRHNAPEHDHEDLCNYLNPRERQLKRKIQDWKLNKNITQDEMRYISKKIKKRKRYGKDSIIRVRGKIVDRKIRRWQSRHVKSENRVIKSGNISSSAQSTLSGISCFTPSNHSRTPTLQRQAVMVGHSPQQQFVPNLVKGEMYIPPTTSINEDKHGAGGQSVGTRHVFDIITLLDQDSDEFEGQSPAPFTTTSSLASYSIQNSRTSDHTQVSVSNTKRYKEEEERHLRLRLDGFLRTVGEHHSAAIDTMTRLCDVLYSQGRHSSAEKLLKQNIKLCQAFFSDRHEQTLLRLGNLVWVMIDQGRYLTAEKIIGPLNEMASAVLPATNPTLFNIKIALSATMRFSGRIKEEESILRDILKASNHFSLVDNERLAAAKVELAIVLYCHGDLHQAEDILR